MTLSRTNNIDLHRNIRVYDKHTFKTKNNLSFKSCSDSFEPCSNEENNKSKLTSFFQKIFSFLTNKEEKILSVKDVMEDLQNNIDSNAAPINTITNFTTKYSSKTSLTTKEGYTIVSMPNSLKKGEISQIPMIVVLDNFRKNNISVNIGCKNTVSHGELVSKYALYGIQDKVELLAIDIGNDETVVDGSIIAKALEKVLELKKAGANIPCINMSLKGKIDSNPFGLQCKSLSKILNIPFDEKNIKNKKNVILHGIKKKIDKYVSARDDLRTFLSSPNLQGNGEYWIDAYQVILAVNKLIENGVEVFIAAGNDGEKTLSLYSLSNAHTVGAKDGNKKERYSSESSLVTDYAQGRYKMKPLYNESGEYIGITDGKITFDKEELGEWLFVEPSMKLLEEKNEYYKTTLEKFLKDYKKYDNREYSMRYYKAKDRFEDADKICKATLITPEYLKLKHLVYGSYGKEKLQFFELEKIFEKVLEKEKDRIGEIEINSPITNVIYGTSVASPTKMNEFIKSKILI